MSKPRKLNFRNFELVPTGNVAIGTCYGEFLIRNCGDTYGVVRVTIDGFELWYHGVCIARNLPLKDALTQADKAFWDRQLNWKGK